MQSIITKYHGPTDTKGSRYTAKCAAGSVRVPMDYSLNSEDNHKVAARALCEKLAKSNAKSYGSAIEDGKGWLAPMVTGALPSGDYCHVFVGGAM